MIAAQVVEKDVLIDTLLAIEEPTSVFPIKDNFLLEGTTDQYKVFWEHVQADIELPYIVVSHIMGGRYQGTRVSQSYSDTVWKVVVHTADMSRASEFANMIALLGDRCPVVTSYTGVSAVTTIQETMPIFDRYQVQNTPQFMVGGLFRLMLNLGEN